MKAVIDRFIEDFAVLETEEGMISLSRAALPEGAREGSHLILRNGGITLDAPSEERARKNINELRRKLFNK